VCVCVRERERVCVCVCLCVRSVPCLRQMSQKKCNERELVAESATRHLKTCYEARKSKDENFGIVPVKMFENKINGINRFALILPNNIIKSLNL
jgi:hypothetical protein